MSETTLLKEIQESPAFPEASQRTPALVPCVDIREGDAELILLADMPGVDATSVEVVVEGHEVTVTGRFVPRPPEGYTATHEEYRSGNYERDLVLSHEIDSAGVKAVVKHGVLRVTLPKAKESQTRRIPVTR